MKEQPVRVWVGPLAKRPGGGARYIQSLASNSVHRLIIVRETPELLWGLNWVGRRLSPCKMAYSEYNRLIHRIDIAHIHRSTLYAEAFRRSQARLPWMFTLHGIGFEEYWKDRPDMVRWIRKANELVLRILEQAPLATVVARWLRDYVEERSSASVVVTPSGVDFREFETVGPSDFATWSGLSEGYLLWVGRLAHEKRLSWFIQLAERMPESQFVAIADSEEHRFLEQHGPRLPSNFRYFGMVPRTYVISAFQGCSVHVSTSLYEAAPTTLLEAMACGKPVVAPDNLGCGEVVQDSRGGFLFDVASLEQLEEQAEKALEHPEVGKRGLDFVRKRRDWRILIRYFDKQYAAISERG